MAPIIAPVIQVLLLGASALTEGLAEGIGADVGVGVGAKLEPGAEVELAEEVEYVVVGDVASEEPVIAVGVTVSSVL